jgi:hypothetical protein
VLMRQAERGWHQQDLVEDFVSLITEGKLAA